MKGTSKLKAKFNPKYSNPAQLKKKKHLTVFLQLNLRAIFSWTENLYFLFATFAKDYTYLCDVMHEFRETSIIVELEGFLGILQSRKEYTFAENR